jgi:hypothetical protein
VILTRVSVPQATNTTLVSNSGNRPITARLKQEGGEAVYLSHAPIPDTASTVNAVTLGSGEILPVELKPGDSVYGFTYNASGYVRVIVD